MFHIRSLLIASTLLLCSCAPIGIATGIAATAGVSASQEGGISGAVSDAGIQIAINDLWFKYDVDTFSKLDLTINNGRVLITGVVQKPEARVEAVRLAWQPKGVKQVINEIRVAESEGVSGYATDTWITTRLRSELIFAKDILSVNYSIDTVQGTIYLMGFAQSQKELNKVVSRARKIKGVKGVVSYVKIAGTQEDAVVLPPRKKGGAPARQGQNEMLSPSDLNGSGGPTSITPEGQNTSSDGGTVSSAPLPSRHSIEAEPLPP